MGSTALGGLARPLRPGVEQVVGGRACLDAYASVLERSDGPVIGEVFRFFGRGPAGMLTRFLDRGHDATFVANQALVDSVLGAQLARTGASVSTYGGGLGVDHVQHAKSLIAPHEALLTTASFSEVTAGKIEMGFLMRDADDVAMMRELAESAESSNAARIRSAAEVSARSGVLLNDPIGNVTHVDDLMRELPERATRSLRAIVKELDDEDTVRSWADAQRRGVQVDVVARDVTDSDRRALGAAGIRIRRMPFTAVPMLDELLGHRLHMTAMFADDALGYVGTRYPWRTADMGRNMGVFLAGDDARRARVALDGLVDRSRVGIVAETLRHPAYVVQTAAQVRGVRELVRVNVAGA